MKRIIIIILIILSMIINASFFVSGNISLFRFSLEPKNCTNLTGNFIRKSLTIGKGDNNFSLSNAIQMTSYDGDFNKLNSTYTESWINYAKNILSKDFTNESICTKLYLGVLVEENPEYRWYNFKSSLIFKPLIGYSCIRNFTQITYCD